MKKVTVINGIAKMRKYNAFLEKKYEKIGYSMTQYQFNPILSFCCHLHFLLDPKVKSLMENTDIIHCQSAGMFPVLAYMNKHKIKKPLIIESPVLRARYISILN